MAEKDARRLRLLRIATNRQLKLMLDQSRETCRPEAALYLRISTTCPLYYAAWDEDEDDADVEIVSAIPQRGSRNDLLEAMSITSGRQTIMGCVTSERKKILGRKGLSCSLRVRACEHVVGGQAFARSVGAPMEDDSDGHDLGGGELDGSDA